MKKYLVQLGRYEPSLAIVEVVSETDKTINAKEIESLWGFVHCSTRMSKDTNLLYESLTDARDSVVEQYELLANRAYQEYLKEQARVVALQLSESESDIQKAYKQRR